MKKCMAILLVVALMFSCSACVKKPIEPEVPTVTTTIKPEIPQTEDPQIEPTKPEIEEPEEETKPGGLIHFPDISLGVRDILSITLGEFCALSDLDNEVDYTVTNCTAGADVSVGDDDYAGTITFQNFSTTADLDFNYPNATLVFNDVTANGMDVVSGAHTLKIQGKLKLTSQLKINGGNVQVTGSVGKMIIPSNSSNDETQITVLENGGIAELIIHKNSVIETANTAKVTVTNGDDQENSATLKVNAKDNSTVYVVNEVSSVVNATANNESLIEVVNKNATAESAVVVLPNNSNANILTSTEGSGVDALVKDEDGEEKQVEDIPSNIAFVGENILNSQSIIYAGKKLEVEVSDVVESIATAQAIEGVDTIVLLSDVASGTLTMTKPLTIDLNKNGITSQTVVEGAGLLTIKNGDIKYSSDEYTAIIIKEGANCQLSNLSINTEAHGVSVSGTLLANNMDITNAEYGFVVGEAGDLTVDNTSVTNANGGIVAYGKVTVDYLEVTDSAYGFIIYYSANVTVNDAYVDITDNAFQTGVTYSNSDMKVVVNGGKFITPGTGWNYCAIYWVSKGYLEINDGYFDGGPQSAGVYTKNGTVVINNGEFTSKDGLKVEYAGDTTMLDVTVNDGKFSGTRSALYISHPDNGDTNVNVLGGTFNGSADYGAVYKKMDCSQWVFISGGLYNYDLPSDCVKTGYISKQTENGYEVVLNS